MLVYNYTQKKVIASTLEFATSFADRFKGLLGRRTIPHEHALLLFPCNAVHTCFMLFDIDVLFVDYCGKIVHIEKSVTPFKFTGAVKKSVMVIELAAGKVNSSGIKNGDQLVFLNNKYIESKGEYFYEDLFAGR